MAPSSRSEGRIDVLVVSLGTTGGWRAAAAELVASLERVGAAVQAVEPEAPRGVRTFALTDFVQARAVRRAAVAGIERAPAPGARLLLDHGVVAVAAAGCGVARRDRG